MKIKVMYIFDMQSKISVIIPTKNRAKFLKKCLNSLKNQSIKPNQVVVADNGSTDNTKKTALSFNKTLSITYVQENKPGVVHARNTGFLNSKYNIVAFIDDDCEPKKNWIENIIKNKKYLKKYIIQGKAINPNKKNIISEVMFFTSETGPRTSISESKITNNAIDGKPIFFDFTDTKNLILNKTIVERLDYLFDPIFEKYNLGEDTELGIRLNSIGINSIYCEEIIVKYNYLTSLSKMIKKSFVLGKTQTTIMKIIKEKYFERYNAEKKYEKIFGKKIIKKIHQERLKKAKKISKEYKEKLLKHYGLFGIIKFNIVLYLHIILKKLGSLYQSLLYLIQLDKYTVKY